MNELKDKKNGSLEGHLGTTHNRLILQEFYNIHNWEMLENNDEGYVLLLPILTVRRAASFFF